MTALTARGSWSQRVGVFSLSLLLGFLIYWLIGFILRDIASIPGPQLENFNTSITQSLLNQEAKRLDQQIASLQKDMSAIQQQQSYVKNAMANTQNTINQLLTIQKLQEEKGQTVNAEVHKAFAEDTQLFLVQQNQLQQINNAMTDLNLELLPLQNHREAIAVKLNAAYDHANRLYQTANEAHLINLGLLQIGLLVVLLLVMSLFLLSKKMSIYKQIYNVVCIAIMVKIAVVMHAYFPSRYFKYILTIALILAVLFILRTLLKKRAFPAKDYLLKQYRDAYAHFLCPVCEYPIRRGPMRFAFWTRRSLAKLQVPAEIHEDNANYHCPQCGTSLYENCQSCQQTRHSLLPYCEHCGAEHR